MPGYCNSFVSEISLTNFNIAPKVILTDADTYTVSNERKNMKTYTFQHTGGCGSLTVEATCTPEAFLLAEELVAYPNCWAYEGMTIPYFLEIARAMFAPAN